MKTTILGFGGSTIGNIDGLRVVSQTDALSAIQTAWDRGIRYFDTAPLYGAGLGEQRMGHAIRQHPRETYIVSTKGPRGDNREQKNSFVFPLFTGVRFV